MKVVFLSELYSMTGPTYQVGTKVIVQDSDYDIYVLQNNGTWVRDFGDAIETTLANLGSAAAAGRQF